MADEKKDTSEFDNMNKFEKFKYWMADTGKQLAIAVLIVLVLRSSIVEPYKIPSGSMIPTLFIGDHIFVNKLAYGLKLPFSDLFGEKSVYVTDHRFPDRGDVIVFRYPKDEAINYIKRVIGLPGDEIAVRNKVLLINNKPVATDPYIDEDMLSGVEDEHRKEDFDLYMADLQGKKHPVLFDRRMLNGADWGPRPIPKGRIFVMGDNRDWSKDSRAWGFVPLNNIKGKAMFIWLNIDLKFPNISDSKFHFWRIAKKIN